MANVTKISVSLPSPLVAELKREARDRGIPLSQLLAEELERGTRAAHLVQTIDELYGPFTDEDREVARNWMASARTPDEILADESAHAAE